MSSRDALKLSMDMVNGRVGETSHAGASQNIASTSKLSSAAAAAFAAPPSSTTTTFVKDAPPSTPLLSTTSYPAVPTAPNTPLTPTPTTKGDAIVHHCLSGPDVCEVNDIELQDILLYDDYRSCPPLK